MYTFLAPLGKKLNKTKKEKQEIAKERKRRFLEKNTEHFEKWKQEHPFGALAYSKMIAR